MGRLSLLAAALLLSACSSSNGDDAAASAGGAAGGGGSAGSGGSAGAPGGGGSAGIGGSAGVSTGGTAGSTGGAAGSGGWAGGTPGSVIQDDPTAARTWPASHGEALISLWSDDAIGTLSITIDDNTQPDHAWWQAQGKAYGLRFTWFVITDKVVGNYGGTWPGFAALVADGHDVQSHTVSHLSGSYTIDEEYKLSQQAIEKNLPNVRALTLAYPGGTHPIQNDPKLAASYYIGARGTTGQNNKIGSTNYMMVNSISGQLNLATDHWAGLPNVVIKNPAQAKSFRAWHCIHYHLLTDAAKSEAITGFKWIVAHQPDLWVGLFREVVQYGRERESATLTVPSVTSDQIVVDVTDTLDDGLFDFPLTVKVGLDTSWSSATATQNGKPVTLQIVQHAGKPFALVSAVPDRGPVILTRN